jgi:hypothetical protein
VRGGAEWALVRGCAGMTWQGWSKHGADVGGVGVWVQEQDSSGGEAWRLGTDSHEGRRGRAR